RAGLRRIRGAGVIDYPSGVPPTPVSSWDLIVGVTGLALCRHVLSGPYHRSRQRIDELRALLAAGDAGWEAVPSTGRLASPPTSDGMCANRPVQPRPAADHTTRWLYISMAVHMNGEQRRIRQTSESDRVMGPRTPSEPMNS